MAAYLNLATTTGIVVCQQDGRSWHAVRRGLEGQRVTSVISREGVILAGTEQGVFRSDDLGESWKPASQGLEELYVRWLAFDPGVSDHEFAGTEPAGIFVSQDGAGRWTGSPEVVELREKFGWYLPYSPGSGCVRGFAFHGSRVYAAVEVGGVLVSDDRGASWRLAKGSTGNPNESPVEGKIHPDVHSLAVHPSSSELVCAPTGGGFFLSRDGGATWEHLYSRCYCRAVWWDPDDSSHLILGPAEGVDYNGRIEETLDGGKSWTPASGEMSVPWRNTMIERFSSFGGQLLAVRSDGVLLTAGQKSLDWRQILPDIYGINAVAVLEE